MQAQVPPIKRARAPITPPDNYHETDRERYQVRGIEAVDTPLPKGDELDRVTSIRNSRLRPAKVDAEARNHEKEVDACEAKGNE
jgi:hypothetical protein